MREPEEALACGKKKHLSDSLEFGRDCRNPVHQNIKLRHTTCTQNCNVNLNFFSANITSMLERNFNVLGGSSTQMTNVKDNVVRLNMSE